MVYEGLVENRLLRVGIIGNKGFETRFIASRPCVQVAAVLDGTIATKSNVVCTFTNETRHA